MPLFTLAAIVLLLTLYGCHTLNPSPVPTPKDQGIPHKAVALVNPPARWVTLAWSNEMQWAGYTVVYGSTNLRNWYSITQLPSAYGNVTVTLSNRPGFEFYRVANWR